MKTLPHDSSMHYWVWVVALALGAAWSLYRFTVRIRRDRQLADTPLVKIRSAAQGYVKVFGRARPAGDTPTAAPLSSRPCVWWSYQVEEKTRNAKGEEKWRVIDNATSVEPFLLQDEDGACLVGPINAEITPTTHDIWTGENPKPSGFPSHPHAFQLEGGYRYTERLLSVGDQLSVAGELRSNSDIQNEDAAAAALLHEWKLDQKALLARFDLDHDGRLNAAEWEAVRRAAAAESQAHNLKASIVRTSVIGQPTHGEPFIIASMDSDHLVRREKWIAAVYLCLGIICAGLGAWTVRLALAVASSAQVSNNR
jgi:hypothetical protein